MSGFKRPKETRYNTLIYLCIFRLSTTYRDHIPHVVAYVVRHVVGHVVVAAAEQKRAPEYAPPMPHALKVACDYG